MSRHTICACHCFAFTIQFVIYKLDGAYDLNEVIWTTFDAGQDYADAEIVSSDGTSVTLDGNSWRGFELPTTVTVTTDTVLSFNFQSTDLCEIHGVALGPVGSDPSGGFKFYSIKLEHS